MGAGGAGPSRPSGRSSPAAPLGVSLGCRAGWAGSADSPGSEPRRRAAAPSVSSAAVGESTRSSASAGPQETAAAAATPAEQGRGGSHSHSSALGAPRRVAMLPGLALVLLAAWTARALEVGAAPRNGVGWWGGRRGPAPSESLIQRSRGAVEGTPLLSTPNTPACGRPAHPRLRPSPALGTRAPASGEGAGEASGPWVRASRGREEEEAVLSSDPDSVPASGTGGRRETYR